ncbi:MAG: LysR family transcriptional regulator, partial [Polyangiaceae bacterium]
LFAAAHIASGAVVLVLPRTSFGSGSIAAVYLDRDMLAPHVRAFIDAIAKWRVGSSSEPSSRL